MIRKFLALTAALASGAMLSVAANTAETTTPGAGAAAPAIVKPVAPAAGDSGEMSQVPAKGPPIVIESGKGTLIRLPKAASTVFIANPDIADVQVKSPLLIYVTAKAPGSTVLYAVDSDDRVLVNASVRVEQDLSRMRQTLSAVAPGENVKVSSVENSLVLSGNVSSAGRAESVRGLAAAIAKETKGTVINRMGVDTPNQVNIRVKVAEVNRNVLKSIGVNWNKLAGTHISFDTFNPTVVAGTLPAGELGVAFGAASWLTQATVDALATEGLLTTLAEPNLTATNGQPASFLAGGEFPVPVASNTQNNVQTITVEFKKFGVSLDVTPTIIDAEHLSLKMRSEVSDLSSKGAVTVNNLTIPALTVRRAETTVELGSGQSFALAGLLQNDVTQSVSKIPWLADIPILGQLFRSERFQRNETELVLIVTPYLVKPTLTSSLAMPTDGFVAPHDAQRVMSGATYRQGLPAPARGPVGAGGQGLIGPVGFRLD